MTRTDILQTPQTPSSLHRQLMELGHDLNNQLVTILGNAELALIELPEDAPLRPSMREIEEAGREASRIVRELVEHTRQNASPS